MVSKKSETIESNKEKQHEKISSYRKQNNWRSENFFKLSLNYYNFVLRSDSIIFFCILVSPNSGMMLFIDNLFLLTVFAIA